MIKIRIKVVYILSTVFLFLISSCVSKKKIVYFQNDTIDQSKVSNSYKTIFKPDDLLQITISSKTPKAVRAFNLPIVAYSTLNNSAVGTPQFQSYLVDNEGYINFPVLGKLKVGGLTRKEVISLFRNRLVPDQLKDPNINIRITNFKITVLGDVKKPGTYTIPNERITIMDAIGLAGDLNISGQRHNIKVHREEGNKKVIYNVDLLSKKTLTSPVYYLQQNDLVVVEHNYAKTQSASSNTNTSLFISITGLLVTIISILTR